MAAYVVVLGRIDDQTEFAKYLDGVAPTLAPHQGQLLAVEDPAELLEGEPPFPRVVLLQFPSKDAAHRWYTSAEYTAVAPHRHKSSAHVFYLIDQFVPPTA